MSFRPVTRLAILAAASTCPACAGGNDAGDAPTFARDVAPIVYSSCSSCHRPGDAAPFPLSSYRDVARRAKQVGIVTESRFMPPWLPAPGVNEFHDDRSLTEEEIDTIRRWVAAGAPEGDPDEAPAPPEWTTGWQLGEPALVARMPAAYTLPAEGRDVYRNFVVPVDVPVDGDGRSEPRWVRAVEFRPDNRLVVHHAVLFVDRSGASRALDAADPVPGYAGMSPGPGARVPDGQFVGWAPGKVPRPGSDDIAWRLDERTDLVLQLHMRPTGRPEQVAVSLGLYFADGPPQLHPVAIRLMSREIDIPAGDADYLVEDEYVLPVDLEVLGVYPHAHYLGKDLQGYATLPDGSRRWLVHIPDWDFNWQDQYEYVEPIPLPKGSTISLHYRFDNSAANPLNPNDPPRRVLYGEQSSDEMAELLLQVLPSREDLPVLWRDFAEKVLADDLAFFEEMARQQPGEARWHALLAGGLLRAGRTAEAIARYEKVVELRPRRVNPLYDLGHARLLHGDVAGATRDLEAVLERGPNHVRALVDLARAYRLAGRSDAAREPLLHALEVEPAYAPASTVLGEILAAEGEREEAERRFLAAVAADPEDTAALLGLARLCLEQGRTDEAIAHARAALAVYPDEAGAHHLLGRALQARGELDAAVQHLALAQRLEPDREEFARDLREALPTGDSAR